MIYSVCVRGGVSKSSEKKIPNIWISVKIACLVSRLRTRIFSLSQTETFRLINVIMKLKKVNGHINRFP